VKIQINDGQLYEIEPELLDYLALTYGNRMLEFVDGLDNTLQLGMKLLTKAVTKKMLESFHVPSKLPRGSDPTVYMIRAYVLLMRESLDMAVLHCLADETGSIGAATVSYEGMDQFEERMAMMLERLKTYAGAGIPETAGSEPQLVSAAGETDSSGTGPVLVARREETQWQDDGGENAYLVALPTVS